MERISVDYPYTVHVFIVLAYSSQLSKQKSLCHYWPWYLLYNRRE